MAKLPIQTGTPVAANCTTDMKEETNMKTMNIADVIAQAQTDIAEKARKIREALVERTAYVVAAKSCPIESAEIREATRNFLASLENGMVIGGADVVLRKDMNGINNGYQTDKVVLSWEKNPKAGEEGKRPNVLWVHVLPQVRPEKSMADKAVSFFQKRFPDMPEGIVRQLFEAGFDGEEVTLCVHPSAKPVVLKAQTGDGQYLLQVPDEKGNFIPNRPIAYQTGNRVYVSIPGTKNGRPWTFRANPVKTE